MLSVFFVFNAAVFCKILVKVSMLWFVCFIACAAHCSRCDAADRGAGKCNDGAGDIDYVVNNTAKNCVPSGKLIYYQ